MLLQLDDIPLENNTFARNTYFIEIEFFLMHVEQENNVIVFKVDFFPLQFKVSFGVWLPVIQLHHIYPCRTHTIGHHRLTCYNVTIYVIMLLFDWQIWGWLGSKRPPWGAAPLNYEWIGWGSYLPVSAEGCHIISLFNSLWIEIILTVNPVKLQHWKRSMEFKKKKKLILGDCLLWIVFSNELTEWKKNGT